MEEQVRNKQTGELYYQVPNLNVHTAELSSINFYRAMWFVNLYVWGRNPYEFDDERCCDHMKAFFSKPQPDEVNCECSGESFEGLDIFYSALHAINVYTDEQMPFDRELNDHDIEINKEKIKFQMECFENF